MIQRIEVKNISTLLSAADLAPILAAVTAQVNEDVRPVWNTTQIVLAVIDNAADWSGGAWRLIIADTAEQVSLNTGDFGDHGQSSGVPKAYVFAKATLDAHCCLSVTISHEILEMLGDPLIDQYCLWSDNPNALFLCRELCDPVQDDTLAYEKNGMLVSDFVTPAFFIPGSASPWDHHNKLQGPNTLAVNGYQQTWDPTNGIVRNTAGSANGRAAPSFSTSYSRRVRRVAKATHRSALARSLVETDLARAPARVKPVNLSIDPATVRWAILAMLFATLLGAFGASILTGMWVRSGE